MNHSGMRSSKKKSPAKQYHQKIESLLDTKSKEENSQVIKAPIKQININGPQLKYERKSLTKEAKHHFYQKDAFNTFHGNRQSLSLLTTYQKIKKISLISLIVLLLIFIMISMIMPYDGICPKNATCRVYAHCHEGFSYDHNLKHCVLKDQLIQKVQVICQNTIMELKHLYGDSECQQEYRFLPNKHIDDIVVGLPKQTKHSLREKLQDYLYNKGHQQKLGFTFRHNRILPKMRELSDFCRIMNFFNSRQFEIPFIFVLFLVCLGLAIYTYILPHLRIKKIYHELRQRTYAEREINVTFIKEEMESEYGQILQSEWKVIDKMRREEGRIMLIYDRFWFWRLSY